MTATQQGEDRNAGKDAKTTVAFHVNTVDRAGPAGSKNSLDVRDGCSSSGDEGPGV